MADNAQQEDYWEIRKFITQNRFDLLDKILNKLGSDELLQLFQQQKGRLNKAAARHSLLMCFKPHLMKLKASYNLNKKKLLW